MNNIQYDAENKKYRKKYKFIKIQIKSLIIENAALCDEVAKIQESIIIVKDERKFLLRKLLEYENEGDTQLYYRNDTIPASNGQRVKFKKKRTQEESGKGVSIS